MLAQAAPLGLEELGRHLAKLTGDARYEVHGRQNVTLDVDTRGHLGERDFTVDQLEDTALGDEEHRLAGLLGVAATEGDLIDSLHELAAMPLLLDPDPILLDDHLSAIGKGAAEHHLAGILADIDESARPDNLVAELADVEVALVIGLGQAQEADVEAATVVEIELVAVVDDRLGVVGGGEVATAGGYTAVGAQLRGQGHEVANALLRRYAGDPFGHADAEVDHPARHQLHGGSPSDYLARVQGHGPDTAQRHLDIAGERRVVTSGHGLHMVLGLGYHDIVHKIPRHLDSLGVQAALLSQVLHLGDDDATAVLRRLGHGELFEEDRLAFHAQVAALIGGRGPDHRHVYREGAVQ